MQASSPEVASSLILHIRFVTPIFFISQPTSLSCGLCAIVYVFAQASLLRFWRVSCLRMCLSPLSGSLELSSLPLALCGQRLVDFGTPVAWLCLSSFSRCSCLESTAYFTYGHTSLVLSSDVLLLNIHTFHTFEVI